MVLLEVMPKQPEELPAWVSIAIWVVTFLFGSGGIAALIKSRHDRNMGIAQQELSEDIASDSRWERLIEVQTKSLLEPLQKRLVEVEGKVESLENELAASRRKYWMAVSYIRQLLIWIAKHLPDDLEDTRVPDAPNTIIEDI